MAFDRRVITRSRLAGLLGDVSLQQLAQTVLSTGSSGSSNPQVQAVMSRSTGFSTPGFQTIKDLANRLAGGFSPPGGLGDSDRNVLQSALSDMNAVLQGGTPSANPVVAQGSSFQTHTIADVRGLTAAIKNLLPQVPSSASSQADAILGTQTSFPTTTPTSIMSYYEKNSQSGYTDRDYAVLQKTLSSLQDLVASASGSPSLSVGTATPILTVDSASPPPPAGTPTITAAPANLLPPATPPYGPGSVYGPPATPMTTLYPAPSLSPIVTTTSSSTAAPAIPDTSDQINLPLIGPVSKPVAVGIGLGVGYLLSRLLRRRGP